MFSRRCTIVILLLFLIRIALACEVDGDAKNQPKTDLNGTWTLDMVGSDFDGSKGSLIYDSLTLVVSYHDPELQMTRTFTKKKKQWSQSLTYYTDGRGENNPALGQNETVQSKTHWEGKILVTKGTSSMQIGGDLILWDIVDKWELSNDRATLIQTSSSRSPRSKFGNTKFAFQERNIKRVFRKKS